MQLRSTLVLAVLFAALGAYLYFVEMERDSDASGNQALAELTRSEVTRVELEHPGRRVVIERRDDGWHMIEPVDASADQRSVDNLIDAVGEFEVKRSLSDVGNLATFALDAPSASIRLHTGKDTVVSIDLGKNAPVGGSIYARRGEEEEVLLVDSALATRINKKASDLRDKRVLAFEEAAVGMMTLRRGSDEIVFERSDGTWIITAPAQLDADPTTVGQLLSSLQSMRATDFVDESGDNLARYGLNDPTAVVVLEPANSGTIELRIGNERDGKLHVRTNDRATVYAVPAWIRDSVDRDLFHFRDKTISSFVAEDAVSVTVTDGDDTRTFVRKDDSWHDSEGAQTNSGAIDAIVGQMSLLAGFEIVADPADDLAKLGLEPPLRTIEVKDAEDVVLGAVRIGSYVADGATDEHSAMAQGHTLVVHLRPAEYERLIAELGGPRQPE